MNDQSTTFSRPENVLKDIVIHQENEGILTPIFHIAFLTSSSHLLICLYLWL